jgi:hypothetical protein
LNVGGAGNIFDQLANRSAGFKLLLRSAAGDLNVDRRRRAKVQCGRHHAAGIEAEIQIGKGGIGIHVAAKQDRVLLGRMGAFGRQLQANDGILLTRISGVGG